MTREERLAIEAILEAEELKENARRRGQRAAHDYDEACRRQDRICDIMGSERINRPFEPVYHDRLDRAYARRTGEEYDDDLDRLPAPEKSNFEKVLDTIGQIAGWANRRTRW